MANGIIPVQWGKELRPSAVNSLDKINEVIHFINQSDIHELTLSDSGSGESVQTANSTQLLDLTVYGKSVQDGTPAPDNPVPVQVVEAPIGLQIGETVTPIDLQGNVLASLPDGTRDVLCVDIAGRVWIDKGVDIITFDGSESGWSINNTGAGAYRALPDALAPANNNVVSPLVSSHFMAISANNAIDKRIGVALSASRNLTFVRDGGAITVTEWKSWLASNPVTLWYPLAVHQTIELGTITPPAIPDGSIIKIDASLTPIIDAEWFTEDTLPKMMNSILGLIKSLHPDDFPTMLSSSLIHSINPTMQVPDIQPIDIVDLGTVEKIKTDATEETENESEVQ